MWIDRVAGLLEISPFVFRVRSDGQHHFIPRFNFGWSVNSGSHPEPFGYLSIGFSLDFLHEFLR